MDYIDIEGYKSIKKAHVELSEINILIGANGSGKSNFLSFFEFLDRIYNQNLVEYTALRGGMDKILHKGRKETQKLSFHLEFRNECNGYSVTLVAGDETFVVTKEELIFEGKPWDIAKSRKEAAIKYDPAYRGKYVLRDLSRLRKYHFHDTSRNSPFTKYSSIETDTNYFYQDGSNTAAFLYSIREKNPLVYKRILSIIQSVAPFISDFYLEPNSSGLIQLLWKNKNDDLLLGPNDFSDGTLRFIALTILFQQPNLPDTIIIDEPELGLHPFAIAKLSGLMKSAAAKGCQIISATQSSDLINYFQPQNILTVNNINGESFFERLNADKLQRWLDDYMSIGDLWKQNIILNGQPK